MRSKLAIMMSGCALAILIALPTPGLAGPGTQGAQQGQQQGAQGDPSARYMEMHRAIGTITNLDQQAGRVTVKLSNGEEVKLNLPPTALETFDNGDRVTVSSQLSLGEHPTTASSGSPRGTASGSGARSGTPSQGGTAQGGAGTR